MTDAEDRTHAPSKQRRQQARERGQAAHSPELTASAALLVAAAVLTFSGPALAASLLGLVRQPLVGAPDLGVSADGFEAVAAVRRVAAAVAVPLGLTVLAPWLAAVAAHQAQVRGLWAPGLLAPDAARLWTPGQGRGLAGNAARGVWSVAKAVAVAAAAVWAVRSEWSGLQALGRLAPQELARASGSALSRLSLALGAATFGLGLIDLVLAARRYETMLSLSPEEQREDLRAAEGDPSLRARRRRLAQAWRADSPEALAGASLVVTGPLGLTVVLAGGPPPRAVTVRSAVAGPPGDRVRRASARSGVPRAEAPALARALGRRPAGVPLSPYLLAELKRLWPAARA